MAFARNDHVVVHGYTEQAPGFRNSLSDLNIGAARFRAAAGVVVDEDQR